MLWQGEVNPIRVCMNEFLENKSSELISQKTPLNYCIDV